MTTDGVTTINPNKGPVGKGDFTRTASGTWGTRQRNILLWTLCALEK